MFGRGISIATPNGDSWCPLWFLGNAFLLTQVGPAGGLGCWSFHIATSSIITSSPPVTGALGVIGLSGRARQDY